MEIVPGRVIVGDGTGFAGRAGIGTFCAVVAVVARGLDFGRRPSVSRPGEFFPDCAFRIGNGALEFPGRLLVYDGFAVEFGGFRRFGCRGLLFLASLCVVGGRGFDDGVGFAIVGFVVGLLRSFLRLVGPGLFRDFFGDGFPRPG